MKLNRKNNNQRFKVSQQPGKTHFFLIKKVNIVKIFNKNLIREL